MPPNERPSSYHSPSESAIPISAAPAWVALGTNLGDSRTMLARAMRRLASLPHTTLEAASGFYRTAPVGPKQPDYLNAVVRLRTSLPPHALLEALQSLEQSAARARTIHWGPRTLDLDLLLYDRRIINERRLAVPHPRMTERAFVLVPLASIDPDLVHPIACETIAALAQRATSEPAPELL